MMSLSCLVFCKRGLFSRLSHLNKKSSCVLVEVLNGGPQKRNFVLIGGPQKSNFILRPGSQLLLQVEDPGVGIPLSSVQGSDDSFKGVKSA